MFQENPLFAHRITPLLFAPLTSQGARIWILTKYRLAHTREMFPVSQKITIDFKRDLLAFSSVSPSPSGCPYKSGYLYGSACKVDGARGAAAAAAYI